MNSTGEMGKDLVSEKDVLFMKLFAGYPVVCHGEECMPHAEGYKGGAKPPLSA